MSHRITGLDHVQLAMPPGGETAAVRFYQDLLGLQQQPKPPVLASRGGCWFSNGSVSVHLGAEAAFVPARKAHPALMVEGFDALVESLASHGHPVRPDTDVPAVRRGYVDDPFGNRIEIVEAAHR